MKMTIKTIEPKKRHAKRCEWCNVSIFTDDQKYIHVVTEMYFFDVCPECFNDFVKKSKTIRGLKE